MYQLLYQEGHEEAQEELPKKAKFFFSTAVRNWDAEFYVKVDDNIDLDLGKVSISYQQKYKAYIPPYPELIFMSMLVFFPHHRGANWIS